MKSTRLISGLAVLALTASAFAQLEIKKNAATTTFYEIGSTSHRGPGGVMVYNNEFPEADPNGLCPPASTCESCGDFIISQIWPGNAQKYYSDDIQLAGIERRLVSYKYLVCGSASPAVARTVTSELWTAGALPGDAPAAAIAGTQSSTVITIDPTFPCFYVTVTAGPGIDLPTNLHLVLTTNVTNSAAASVYSTILDVVEVGGSLNQTRRSSGGTPGPWSAIASGAAPFCPPAANESACTGGNSGCTAAGVPAACCTGANAGTCNTCTAYRAFWAQIVTTGVCGNGIVEAGEDCELPGTGCCDATCKFVAAGTPCRASAGVCDAAESCTGQSGACPADGFSTGNVCRQAAGPCDVAESCDGSGINCPADGFAAAGTSCRASTGACDPAESCNGTSPACPPDVTITSCISGDGCCPAGCTNATDSDCPLIVPTVSEWGLALLTLVGIAMGAVVFSRKASAAKA